MRLCYTAIDDNTIRLFRDPVIREIAGVKTYDSIRDNRTSYTLGLDFEEDVYASTCCQVFRCNIAIPGDHTSDPNIDLLTVRWLKNEEEIMDKSGRTEIINSLNLSPDLSETRYSTQLFLRSFETSDIGIYQCVYTDFDTDRELVYSTPFKLDSSKSLSVYSLNHNVLLCI